MISRFIALLIIPCLLADPAFASGISQGSFGRHSNILKTSQPTCFLEQALMLRVPLNTTRTMGRPVKSFWAMTLSVVAVTPPSAQAHFLSAFTLGGPLSLIIRTVLLGAVAAASFFLFEAARIFRDQRIFRELDPKVRGYVFELHPNPFRPTPSSIENLKDLEGIALRPKGNYILSDKQERVFREWRRRFTSGLRVELQAVYAVLGMVLTAASLITLAKSSYANSMAVSTILGTEVAMSFIYLLLASARSGLRWEKAWRIAAASAIFATVLQWWFGWGSALTPFLSHAAGASSALNTASVFFPLVNPTSLPYWVALGVSLVATALQQSQSPKTGMNRRKFGTLLVGAVGAAIAGVYGVIWWRSQSIDLEPDLDRHEAEQLLSRLKTHLDDLAKRLTATGKLSGEALKAFVIFREHLDQDVRINKTTNNYYCFSIQYPLSGSTGKNRKAMLGIEISTMKTLLDSSIAGDQQATQNLVALAINQGAVFEQFDAEKFRRMTRDGQTRLAGLADNVRDAYESFVQNVQQNGLLLLLQIHQEAVSAGIFHFNFYRIEGEQRQTFAETWVGQSWEVYQALMSRAVVGGPQYQLLQWALMVKEGAQARLFDEYPRIYAEIQNLSARIKIEPFNLKNPEERRAALSDTKRFEEVKHLLARQTYMESVGYEAFLDYCKQLGVTDQMLVNLRQNELDENLRALIDRFRDILVAQNLQGAQRTRVLRVNIFAHEVRHQLIDASKLILAEGIEKGTMRLEEDNTVAGPPGSLDFLLDPKYSDEDRHAEKHPEFSRKDPPAPPTFPTSPTGVSPHTPSHPLAAAA